MVTREQILERKKATFEITVAGIRQKHEFTLEYSETAVGKIPFLTSKRMFPINELMRIADETGLPVNSAGQKLFPKGKGPRDFLGL